MTRKEREAKRAAANGEVFQPSRRPAIPGHRVMKLKTSYNRHDFDYRQELRNYDSER